MNDTLALSHDEPCMNDKVINRLRDRISGVRRSLESPEIVRAARDIVGSREEVSRLLDCLNRFESQLKDIPAIEIAFVGPSRHGKSTLLNALAGQTVLPTSDVQPCTASVVRLKWAPEWSVTVTFVSKEILVEEWKSAVREASDYLKRCQDHDPDAPDDSRFLHNTLERFIKLFRLDPEDDPVTLIDQVRRASIPSETAKLLGKPTRPKTLSFEAVRHVVDQYLSTKDVNWTIVDSCDIAGPFDGWHPKLTLVDLPGTNDTNSQRTAITNSLREKAQAVAIVTSDSNLGTDIDSWLRNSTVLANFLEAKDSRRQRLFIVRTKLDSHQPQLDCAVNDDEDEERLYRNAVKQYKSDQAKAFRAMLRDIVMPMLPFGSADDAMTQKRRELLDQISDVPVHFVSAFAHEAFAGRLNVGKTRLRHMVEHLGSDANATGIPALREHASHIAADWLERNFYEDIDRQLEREVGLLARYFRKESSVIQAQLSGAGQSVRALVGYVQGDVLPWIHSEVSHRISDFQQAAYKGGSEVRHRLDQVWAMSERRFHDKVDKWTNYAWNTLKATARKQGVHTTCLNAHVDINQDICSVLVDDLVLAWSSYRDYLIDQRIDQLTDDFARQLRQKLDVASSQTDIPEAKAAISDIVQQLQSITYAQRQEMLRQVNAKIRQLESIRQPAYAFIQQAMAPTFQKIQGEFGTGCQQRMRQHLVRGFEQNIDRIRNHIADLVNGSVTTLLDSCTAALGEFGKTAANRIAISMESIAETQRMQDVEVLQARRQLITSAIRALPIPSDPVST